MCEETWLRRMMSKDRACAHGCARMQDVCVQEPLIQLTCLPLFSCVGVHVTCVCLSDLYSDRYIRIRSCGAFSARGQDTHGTRCWHRCGKAKRGHRCYRRLPPDHAVHAELHDRRGCASDCIAQPSAILARLVSAGRSTAGNCMGSWHMEAEQSNAFTTALGFAAGTYTQGQGRRSCQDIQNFDPYLSISDMEILQGDANAHTKIECVVSRCCKLGLVLPSESSTRMIMAACFAAGVPAATHEEKFGMVKEFKRQLKAKVAKMPRSSTHLQRYPPTPANLPPALLQDAYSADDPPVGQNQQLPAHLVQEMAQGTALRRTSRHVRKNPATQGPQCWRHWAWVLLACPC